MRKNGWTDKEVEILSENYTKMTMTKMTNLLPSKTRKAITRKAEKLGLRKRSYEKWSAEEIKTLSENMKVGFKLLGEMIPRHSIDSIRNMKKDIEDAQYSGNAQEPVQ